MSSAPGNREVAHRLFAAEYDDATLEYAESEEERAPNYVVTPTGARVNRLFVAGVLTAVETVNEETVRARVVDPTGAFVVYAGQYQPDELAFFERTDPPTFVAITGKANAFQPDGSDRVLTSVRPESVNEIDADTRDRWVVNTAAQTLDRIEATAGAIARDDRGDELASALQASGIDPGLAEGIALAIDHYGTTPEYLEAVRETALDAVEVVAGEREEARPLELEPGEGDGTVSPESLFDESTEPAATVAAAAESQTSGTPTDDGPDLDPERSDDDGTGDEPIGSEDRSTAAEADPVTDSATDAVADDASAGDSAVDEGSAVDSSADDVGGDEPATEGSDVEIDSDPSEGADTETDRIGDFDDGGFGADPSTGDESDDAPGPSDAEAIDLEDVDEDELYEVDEEERERIESEHGLEFTTGSEVDDPGEADIDVPDPVPESGPGPDAGASESEVPESGADDEGTDDSTAGDSAADDAVIDGSTAEDATVDDPTSDAGSDSEADDIDLEIDDVLLDRMAELDDGDGADRSALIEAVADATGATEDEIDDAIDEAMMSGRCYEPGDGRLKPI